MKWVEIFTIVIILGLLIYGNLHVSVNKPTSIETRLTDHETRLKTLEEWAQRHGARF